MQFQTFVKVVEYINWNAVFRRLLARRLGKFPAGGPQREDR